MRLLELKIRNIASLKGEHLISFRDIMAASPLFAITGETGAGKSSILNSIGLALYGDIFKKNVQQNDVVTLGEKEGQIELLFQVREKTYLATWRARVLKQNGEAYSTPQSPIRELYEVDGDQFTDTKNITTKPIQEILHLDFDQFCKCIILNQGEFAKFLSSSFTERKAILEKLYPGEVLENLSAKLKSDLDRVKEDRKQLETEMQTIKDSGQNGDELKKKQEQLQAQLKTNSIILAKLLDLDQLYKTLRHYFEESIKNQKKIDQTKTEVAELTTVQNKNHLAATGAHELYDQMKKKELAERPRLQELLKLEEKLTTLESLKKSQETKSTKASQSFQDAQKRFQDAQDKESVLQKQNIDAEKRVSLPIQDLKTHHKNLESLFTIYQDRHHLYEADFLSRKRLQELEDAGKERALELSMVKKKIESIPKELLKEIDQTITSRDELKLRLEKKQKAEILSQELSKHLEALTQELISENNDLKTIEEKSVQLEIILKPLRLTKKMSGLISAVTVCRTHESTVASETCPVCETHISKKRWHELQSVLNDQSLQDQLAQLDEIERQLLQTSEEKKQVSKKITLTQSSIELKTKEQSTFQDVLKASLPSLDQLDKKISELNESKWELQKLQVDEKKIQDSLTKAREDFARLRTEQQSKATQLQSKEAEMATLAEHLQSITGPAPITEQKIYELKSIASFFKEFSDSNAKFEHATKDRQHLEEVFQKAQADLKVTQDELHVTTEQIKTISTELTNELGTEKASVKMATLTAQVTKFEDEYKKLDAIYRQHDQLLKEVSGRLLQLIEHIKDIELQFIRTRDDLKAQSLLPFFTEREPLLQLLISLKDLSLDLLSPRELYVPLQELLLSEKTSFEEQVTHAKEELAATLALLQEWEKQQDKIALLELKNKDVMSRLQRFERLASILGKDDLRSFVLSLVEVNLIQQTNDELQKLCQGRYEIQHQSKTGKLTPEFYVLDKFREGGLRKVATLSGGETFMVSLAMAIALAEMTRGQAEIDSLFIDEGFGTLDQDSLEDVLDMLNQIQTRGLMVGIISHIKPLTNALPVNLVVDKKHDGTSTLSLQYN